ncbi:MAG: type II toxin-antitoxin system HicA family toxin [Flavobacterium sp.]|nr:type II toxin-antitoxin system HicA family toxin [Flavobacterium sp.]
MKKIPRDIGASELIKLLTKRYGYKANRQTGSHIRLTTLQPSEHHITVPNHQPIKIGTLSAILSDVATHQKLTKQQLIEELF